MSLECFEKRSRDQPAIAGSKQSSSSTSVWRLTQIVGSYVDKAPLQLWEVPKIQLASQPEVLYSLDSFREWCSSSFNVLNHERHALTRLERLRHTGSVAEYKTAHNALRLICLCNYALTVLTNCHFFWHGKQRDKSTEAKVRKW
ncbi:TPA: hypothetical protein ACH3X1_003094 [Trebouxia sp. C0004]